LLQSTLMNKVILYYNFTPLDDPDAIRLWQKNLCERLNLKGRIIVAEQGINGTLGGYIDDVKSYIKEMKTYPQFKNTQYKWSDGAGDDFPKLSVKVRPELITLQADEEFDVFNSTSGFTPEQWHEYIEQNPDVIILDARNDYESDIGAFKGANVIKPKINAFKEIKGELDKLPKDQPILTYCTGDVRCEYLSAYMTHKGFDEVHHLKGGIVKYGQQFGDDGFWEGKCFTFDNRLKLEFSNESEDIGDCSHCESKTSNHINCQNSECNRLVLVCEDCADNMSVCSKDCLLLATAS